MAKPVLSRIGLALVSALALALASAPARAQPVDCERLRAALDRPSGDPGAAQQAYRLRDDIDRLSAHAEAIGCNNRQFLFFGSAPPPECGGVTQKLAAMRARYEALRARAGVDPDRRQELVAQYAAACDGELPRDPAGGPVEERAAHGGGEALCVRKCDGYFFPLTPAMRSDRAELLRDLCQASCPDAEIGLYSRAAHADISTAVSAESGDRYDDLPNALKYTKKFDPACSCKKPQQGWAEVLGRAEGILTDIEGERPGEGPLTEKQADERSHAQAAKVAQQDQGKSPPAKAKKLKLKPMLSPLDPGDGF